MNYLPDLSTDLQNSFTGRLGGMSVQKNGHICTQVYDVMFF